MKELQIIYDACCRGAGLDIGQKSRLRRIVYARYCYYHYAKKMTVASLAEIGWVCGERDHATVIHGLKKFKVLKKYEDFQRVLELISKEIPEQFNDGITKEQREIKMLYSNKNRLEKQVELLSKRIANTEVEREILDMFNTLPADKLIELKEYRIKPFLKMNAL